MQGLGSRPVDHWRVVQKLEPSHPDVNKHLPAAERRLRNGQPSLPEPSERTGFGPGQTLRIRAVGDLMLGTSHPEEGAHLPPDDVDLLKGARAIPS